MILFFIVFGIAVVSTVTVLLGVRQVNQGQVAIVERLGRYHRTLAPGLNWIVPFLDKEKIVRHVNRPGSEVPPNRLDMREQVLDVKEETGIISKDNVVLTVDTVIFYQVTDPVKACYEIAQPVDGIVQICRTTLRSIFGEMDLDTSLASRELVNVRLRAALDEVTDRWGIRVNRVEIQKINPPADLVEVMKQQMIAERNRRALVTEAEGTKQKQILEAEGIKTAAILQAEGEYQATILKAEAAKKQKILEAEGEAEGIRVKQEATARGFEMVRDALSRVDGVRGLLVIETLRAQQEIAKALATGPNSKFYLPSSLAGLYGAIDSIKEMLKFDEWPVGGGSSGTEGKPPRE